MASLSSRSPGGASLPCHSVPGLLLGLVSMLSAPDDLPICAFLGLPPSPVRGKNTAWAWAQGLCLLLDGQAMVDLVSTKHSAGLGVSWCPGPC